LTCQASWLFTLSSRRQPYNTTRDISRTWHLIKLKISTKEYTAEFMRNKRYRRWETSPQI